MFRSFRSGRFVAVCVLGACVAGCGSQAPMPSGTGAREALEKSLTAWKNAKPPGTVDAAQFPIHAVDSVWGRGRKLDSFEVLREDATDTEKRFTVRLALLNPKATEETEYVVMGKDPVWVYRGDDYARLLNMDNNPAPRPVRGRRP